MIIVYVFLGLVLLRVVLIGLGAAMLIRPVQQCPACFYDTLKLQRSVVGLKKWIEWRWCPSCSWQGLARVTTPIERVPERIESQKPGHRHTT
jgi:hypothetical protein